MIMRQFTGGVVILKASQSVYFYNETLSQATMTDRCPLIAEAVEELTRYGICDVCYR